MGPVTASPAYSDAALRHFVTDTDARALLNAACAMRDLGHGNRMTYSRKVFIPLTRLCRDVCSYCTFAHPPRKGESAYLSADEVLAIARAGAAAGCTEALFTLGDKPELRYRIAREELAHLGHASTISYLAAMCRLVLDETGLLPHANPGVMSGEEILALRDVTISQGIMLESTSQRLCEPGGPHYGSPDKAPDVRLESIRLAGTLNVPFTSGILIGIGETRDERLDAMLALRDLHRQHGHLQEVIVQNFRAKPNTRMANAPDPDLDDLMWTIALARLVFGPEMNIQAPPNLSGDDFGRLIDAGINDWGGVSPVTPDHVNPEAAWPQIEVLRRETETRGKVLTARLAAYPPYVLDRARWQSIAVHTPLLRAMDASGLARADTWSPGVAGTAIPVVSKPGLTQRPSSEVAHAIARARGGKSLSEAAIVTLFEARGGDFDAVCTAADELRRETVGDVVRYVVNRNINYTNVCYFRCGFCAFSKGKTAETLRGAPYDLAHDEIARRVTEAWERGATEVCMQGGIHPRYTGETYIELCRTAKRAVPDIHIHAFSPLEITHGAQTLGISVPEFLRELKAAGLGTVPGTAAEVLDDEVRAILCPDKINAGEWLDIIGAAHDVGLRSTSTIMFGHVDTPLAWARHLLKLRGLQERTGGITEFVPLPFIHMEAPMYLKGRARKGPTWRETVLMHAVARLALHPLIPNIQLSWVKAGPDGARVLLRAGANDLGGTLMNESISRAAGTEHGQEMPPVEMDRLITSIGRQPVQRTTLYGMASDTQRDKSYRAAPLTAVVQTPVTHRHAPHTVAAE
ncbi:MAG: 7,8-didemethyl-8-hydroxy-5-deazariboflavin synthase subunit CofH [Rhodospirillaceae bacterium]|nr:MAG: 7,8-didemethyl-8-hydroxy-5-deazariboflavin synthase subunit CofH [Rhodospirillaceae bacterium]